MAEEDVCGDIVEVKHRADAEPSFLAWRFAWEGALYYAVPHDVGTKRFAWREADGITLVRETGEQLIKPQWYARGLVSYVEAAYFAEESTKEQLLPELEMFRKPPVTPLVPRTPELQELRDLGLM